MSWIKKAQQRQQVYYVFINKFHFPPELQSKKLGKEDFEQWKIKAVSRQDAAQKIWTQHGQRLLSLMGPKKTKLPRKVSLHVSDPRTKTAPGRLDPILVYVGD